MKKTRHLFRWTSWSLAGREKKVEAKRCVQMCVWCLVLHLIKLFKGLCPSLLDYCLLSTRWYSRNFGRNFAVAVVHVEMWTHLFHWHRLVQQWIVLRNRWLTQLDISKHCIATKHVQYIIFNVGLLKTRK